MRDRDSRSKRQGKLEVCQTPRFRDPDAPSTAGPSLVIPRPLWDDIQGRSRLLDIEISGLGAVVPENGNLVVKKLYRVPQICSGGNTSIDQDNPRTHQAILQCAEEFGIDPRLWWHSHHSMGAFWSGTDQKTKTELFKDWGVAVVLDHIGHYKASLLINKPVPLEIEIPVIAVGQPEAIDYERLRKEIAEDVVENVLVITGQDCWGTRDDILTFASNKEEDDDELVFNEAGLSAAGGPAPDPCKDCHAPCGGRDWGDRWDYCPYFGKNGPFRDSY